MPTESALSIRTEHLELRPVRAADATALFPVLSDPALYEFSGDAPPESVDALRRLYAFREARRSPDGTHLWLNWAVRERAGPGTPVGYVQATVGPAHADVAWVIGVAWQNRGYASEAATALVRWLETTLGAPRVRATIHPGHVASQRVAARAGLLRTGAWSDGEEIWTLG